MRISGGIKIRYLTLASIFFMQFLSVSTNASGQFAYVRGKIVEQGNVNDDHAIVTVYSNPKAAPITTATAKNGEYKIVQQLYPNVKYSFVACSSALSDEDKTNWKGRKLGSSPVTIDFLLGSPLEGADTTPRKIAVSKKDVMENSTLELKDMETKCVIGTVEPDRATRSADSELIYTVSPHAEWIYACTKKQCYPTEPERTPQ